MASSFRDAELTDDAFLGGRVRVLQPELGYRAAADAVLLAAACPAVAGERVLDVGSGAGVASLCLAARVRGLSLEGVELQPAYAELSRRNALRNGVSWLVHEGDLRAAPLFARATAYDRVLSNPPYFEAEAGPASPSPARDLANRETAPLEVWIDFCLRRLRPKGSLTMIHRAERLGAILAALEGRAGAIEVIPLWPRAGVAAKRVIVRAVKESRAPLTLAPGLALHAGGPGEGAYTPEAEAILKDGEPLMPAA